MQAFGFLPGYPLQGRARVPPSKSWAQRALLAASVCADSTRLVGIGSSADVRACSALIANVGAVVQRLAPQALAIRGVPPGPHRGWQAAQPLDLGESGTLARCATAIGALCGWAGHPLRLEARGTLLRRHSAPLLISLAKSGVRVEYHGRRHAWPLSVTPLGPPSQLTLVDPLSSQELSALLLAGAAYPDELEVLVQGQVPSVPYVELTAQCLRRFGVHVEHHGNRWRVRGPLRAPGEPLSIELDASSAAIVLAAGVLSGGSVEVVGIPLDSAQPDLAIVRCLQAMGAHAQHTGAALQASGSLQRACQLDLEPCPDLAVVIAALAAAHAWQGGGVSELRGLGTLPGKESSRLEVLARGFEAAGIAAQAGPDWLRIGPRQARDAQPCQLDPQGDHRMAFAFALLSLVRPGIQVLDPDCVRKSWPQFWTECLRLGARQAER